MKKAVLIIGVSIGLGIGALAIVGCRTSAPSATTSGAVVNASSSRSNPAPVGSAISAKVFDSQTLDRKSSEVRLTLQEVLRGKEAEERVEPSSIYPDLKPGFEWIVARVRVELLKAPNLDTKYRLIGSGIEFKAVSSEGKVYEGGNFLNIRFTGGQPIQVELYEGAAAHEGWMAFHIAQSDRQPLLRFDAIANLQPLWWKLY